MATQPAIVQRALAAATERELLQTAVTRGDITILWLLDRLPWFKTGADWTAWRAFLCAIYGLPMTARELAIYRECTGRTNAPTAQAREFYVPTGRRARKSAIAALMAVWAGLRDYTQFLAPGERAMVPVIAKNKEDAQAIRRFVLGLLNCRALKWMLEGEPKEEEIRLATRVDIRIRAATVMAGRGQAIPLALLDEAAFFRTDESANPDVEIIRGIRPGMATIPGAMLGVLSSPYAPRGVLFDAWRSSFGRDGDVVVWQAPTLRMHDTPQIRAEVDKAYADDPVSADSEYGAKFRADLTPYISEEMLTAVTVTGRTSLPRGRFNYHAFVDTSGGSQDAMSLSIFHYDPEGKKVVQDLLEEWTAPFDPEVATEQAAVACKGYGVLTVRGDRYAGEWPRSRFRANGISYAVSDRVKSEIYSEGLPLLTSERIELLDNKRLRVQLMGLDRKAGRSGKDSIDHRPGMHDDLANATLGAALEAMERGAHLPLPKEEIPSATTTEEILRRARADEMRKSREKALGTNQGGAMARLQAYRRRGRH